MNYQSGYRVVFMVNQSKTVITRYFDSPYKCKIFVNKLNYSKKCTLISCPVFS